HPLVHGLDGDSQLARIDGTAAFAALERPLAPVPSDAVALGFGVEDLAGLRTLAVEMGEASGLSAQRTEDLALVITELASNSIRHGRPVRTLSIWQRPGVVTCQTSNGGLIGDVLVGRRRPDPHQL